MKLCCECQKTRRQTLFACNSKSEQSVHRTLKTVSIHIGTRTPTSKGHMEVGGNMLLLWGAEPPLLKKAWLLHGSGAYF